MQKIRKSVDKERGRWYVLRKQWMRRWKGYKTKRSVQPDGVSQQNKKEDFIYEKNICSGYDTYHADGIYGGLQFQRKQ